MTKAKSGNKMRIGIDIKAFKNGSTGIARYLKSMLWYMMQYDSENEYFLFQPVPNFSLDPKSNWHLITTNWKIPGTLWLEICIPYYLKKYHIDIFWAPEQVCPHLFTGKTKIITTVHDLTYHRYPETVVMTNMLILNLLMKATINRSDAIITVSDYVKREILSLFGWLSPGKVHTISNGGPQWDLPPDYQRARRGDFLFFAGNLEPRKNIYNVIRALEILHEKGVSIPLYIAGPKGWKNKEILKHIHNSTVKNNIHQIGYVSEEDLKTNYQKCKALIYPSFYEGFGLPLLEALSQDCPVITSKGTVMEEIGGDAVLLVDPKDPNSIATGILNLIKDDTLISKLLKHRDEVLNTYTWQSSAEKLVHLFSYLYKNS